MTTGMLLSVRRCGMSGEAAPRHIIRSQVTMKPYGQVRLCGSRKGDGELQRVTRGQDQTEPVNRIEC